MILLKTWPLTLLFLLTQGYSSLSHGSETDPDKAPAIASSQQCPSVFQPQTQAAILSRFPAQGIWDQIFQKKEEVERLKVETDALINNPKSLDEGSRESLRNFLRLRLDQYFPNARSIQALARLLEDGLVNPERAEEAMVVYRDLVGELLRGIERAKRDPALQYHSELLGQVLAESYVLGWNVALKAPTLALQKVLIISLAAVAEDLLKAAPRQAMGPLLEAIGALPVPNTPKIANVTIGRGSLAFSPILLTLASETPPKHNGIPEWVTVAEGSTPLHAAFGIVAAADMTFHETHDIGGHLHRNTVNTLIDLGLLAHLYLAKTHYNRLAFSDLHLQAAADLIWSRYLRDRPEGWTTGYRAVRWSGGTVKPGIVDVWKHVLDAQRLEQSNVKSLWEPMAPGGLTSHQIAMGTFNYAEPILERSPERWLNYYKTLARLEASGNQRRPGNVFPLDALLQNRIAAISPNLLQAFLSLGMVNKETAEDMRWIARMQINWIGTDSNLPVSGPTPGNLRHVRNYANHISVRLDHWKDPFSQPDFRMELQATWHSLLVAARPLILERGPMDEERKEALAYLGTAARNIVHYLGKDSTEGAGLYAFVLLMVKEGSPYVLWDAAQVQRDLDFLLAKGTLPQLGDLFKSNYQLPN